MAPRNHPGPSSLSTRTETPSSVSPALASQIARITFTLLFLEMAVLLFASILQQRGPFFVTRFYLGYDHFVFYNAAHDWLAHQDPYQRRTFITPPSSMFATLPLSWLSFPREAIVFTLLNAAIVFGSLFLYLRRLRTSSAVTQWIFGIAILYYPLLYLLDRGNLDGLVLGCILCAALARSRTLAALGHAAAIALKLYPVLLLLPLLRSRRYSTALLTLLFCAVLQLPFLGIERSFLHAVVDRGGRMWVTDNFSPAVLLYTIALALHLKSMVVWKSLYSFAWLATLAVAACKRRLVDLDTGVNLIAWVPWMVSFPVLVYPYVGILFLPVFAWRLQRLTGRSLDLSAKLFFAGFLLTSFQSNAFAFILHSTVFFDRLLYITCAIGVLLILISHTLLMAERSDAGTHAHEFSPASAPPVTT